MTVGVGVTVERRGGGCDWGLCDCGEERGGCDWPKRTIFHCLHLNLPQVQTKKAMDTQVLQGETPYQLTFQL